MKHRSGSGFADGTALLASRAAHWIVVTAPFAVPASTVPSLLAEPSPPLRIVSPPAGNVPSPPPPVAAGFVWSENLVTCAGAPAAGLTSSRTWLAPSQPARR